VGNPKDGGDKGSGMADADEEDKVNQVKPPYDHITHPGGEETIAELYKIGVKPPGDYRQKKQDKGIIPFAGLS
jgi:hypothetical protein